jgi:hypothetical protein
LRKKIGPDPRNFNQRVSLGRNDLLIRTFLKEPAQRRVFAFGLVHRWTGQSLVSTEIKWYRINYSGQEEEYFNMLLEGVRIVSISPAMATGDNPNEIPMETVELRYEKITWKHNDGNIIFSDAWNERQSA